MAAAPMEQQAAPLERKGRAPGIDGLVEDDEVDFLGGDLRRDLGEVEDGAGLRQEPRDDELVAFADERQGLGQRLARIAPSLGGMATQRTAAAPLSLRRSCRRRGGSACRAGSRGSARLLRRGRIRFSCVLNVLKYSETAT
jgi:hypothetical protein